MATSRLVTAALTLLPAFALAGCVVASSDSRRSGSGSSYEVAAPAPGNGPELLDPPGGPFKDETPRAVPQPAPRPAQDDSGPQLMEPPGVVIDGTPSRPMAPPPGAEPARARPAPSAYTQAVDCAAGLTSLLNSMTYAMSQREANLMASDQTAWRDMARSMDNRADTEIDRRAGQLNDITADRIVRACPPAPRAPE